MINKPPAERADLGHAEALQRPTDEGIALLNAIQDVYLNEDITVA